MHVQFLGAAGTVTGSKFLVDTGDARVLVDCGMFQGYKQLRLRNWRDLPVSATTIDAVVLTHAHIDHSGWLPALVKRGFRGTIYATDSTRDLCEVLLLDSAHIQEEEAEYANRKRFSRHREARPLYTRKDVEETLPLFEVVEYGEERQIASRVKKARTDLSFHYSNAGHILGSGLVHLSAKERLLLFTGDLGRPGMPIMEDPATVERADYLFLESTYGRRKHSDTDPREELAEYAKRTIERGGTLLIPSFAVARAQLLCLYLRELIEEGRIPEMPIYLNSPMALNVTKLYVQHHDDHRLTAERCREVFSKINYVRTVDESKRLNGDDSPKIVISSSGMATGGRVLHHLKAWGGDRKNTVLFVGYQAGGTRGRDLVDGRRSIKIHGRYQTINAEIGVINSLSAHADWEDSLAWLESFEEPPRETFLVHGDEDALDAMRKRVEERFGWRCSVPEHKEVFELD